MIDVFLCEDDDKQLSTLSDYIHNYILIENLDMKLSLATSNPYKILNYMRENNVTKGIFFLDISLNSSINGIELAAKIRSRTDNSKIIFITSHSEMVFLTFKYQIEALDFILKDDPEKIQGRITADLALSAKEFLKNEIHSDDYYLIKNGSQLRSVKTKNILFFESSTVPHKVIVHLVNGQIEFYSTVKSIESENESFFRCHKSYVVNLDNIVSIDSHTRTLTMSNGEQVLCSVMACRELVKMMKK